MSESGFSKRRTTGHGSPRRDSVAEPAPARVGWHEAITATVGGLGFELVDIERAQRGLLRVTIDRIPGHAYRLPDGSPDAGDCITVDDCEQVTRQLQYVLEVEGLDYARLEVSSPGLDRPLKREADYARFAGQKVALTLRQPFEGRKAWQGLLGRGEGESWCLTVTDGKTEQVLGFTLAEVREARLVPVLDFKGRKSRDKAADSVQTPAVDAAPAKDGG